MAEILYHITLQICCIYCHIINGIKVCELLETQDEIFVFEQNLLHRTVCVCVCVCVCMHMSVHVCLHITFYNCSKNNAVP